MPAPVGPGRTEAPMWRHPGDFTARTPCTYQRRSRQALSLRTPVAGCTDIDPGIAMRYKRLLRSGWSQSLAEGGLLLTGTKQSKCQATGDDPNGSFIRHCSRWKEARRSGGHRRPFFLHMNLGFRLQADVRLALKWHSDTSVSTGLTHQMALASLDMSSLMLKVCVSRNWRQSS